jgi:HD-like signal output (HDOD) protein
MPTAEKLVQRFTDAKTLPHVALKVNQMVNDGNCTMQDFEETIQMDPILVARLLRQVNSPFFGLANKVEAIGKAVVFVGMKSLRNLVSVEALRDLFSDDNPQQGFSRNRLWLHSATIATLADMIGKRIFGDAREDLFLAGIIHDIGMIIEDQTAGDLLRQACLGYKPGAVSLIDSEREIIGTDHCKVGSLIAKEWNMPDDILKAIRFHHDNKKKVEIGSVISIIQLAEYIAGKMKFSAIDGKADPLPPNLIKHVKGMMTNYKVIARDLPAEMAKAKDLYDPDGSMFSDG